MRRSLMLATSVAALAFTVGACSSTPDVKNTPNTASTPTAVASPSPAATAVPVASPTGSPVATDKKPGDNTNVKPVVDDKKPSEVNTNTDKNAKPAASPVK